MMNEICTTTRNNLKIYYIGDISLLDQQVIAVIGKRDITDNEKIVAKNIGKVLAMKGYVVLNGLALGTDKAALEGALEAKGKTIAVLPCGLDTVYPKSCTKLAENVVKNGGCLISTYPIGTEVTKYRFIERDKIQALLAKKVCVVTCSEKGGTMHTITDAFKMKKEIGVLLDSDGNEYARKHYHAKRLNNFKELLEFADASKEYEQLNIFDLIAN